MRIMAIDYGEAHTGAAISDPEEILCGYTTVIHSRDRERLVEELSRLVREQGVEALVLGLPKNMDGSEGPKAELCRDFALVLEDRLGLPTALWDERRTTVDAHRILFEAGKNARKRKKNVDAVAASLILEGYLAYRRSSRGRDICSEPTVLNR